MRFRNPMKEGLSTLSWERVEVRGCEWMAYRCLYWPWSGLRSESSSSGIMGSGGGARFVGGLSAVNEIEVEVADREAIGGRVCDKMGGRGRRGEEGRERRGEKRRGEEDVVSVG